MADAAPVPKCEDPVVGPAVASKRPERLHQPMLDFSQSAAQRRRREQRRLVAQQDQREQPTLFVVALPDMDVHVASPYEAGVTLAGDVETSRRWLEQVVGPVQQIKGRQYVFPVGRVDRLLGVIDGANVTLDAAAMAVARGLWAHSLGLRPLQVRRVKRRLLASSPRWPAGLNVKDVPWTAVSALIGAGVAVDVDPSAARLLSDKMAGSGHPIARGGLAGSSIMLSTSQPTLLEQLDIPGLAYAGGQGSGRYRLPVLAGRPLLDMGAVELSKEAAAEIRRVTGRPSNAVPPDGFPWTLYPFQARDAGRGLRILEVAGGVLFAGDMGSGKEQPVTEVVAVPRLNGAGVRWQPIGTLRAGDQVWHPSGRIQTVTGVYPQGTKPVFTVRCDDGATATAGGAHWWPRQTGDGEMLVTTADLAGRCGEGPVAVPLVRGLLASSDDQVALARTVFNRFARIDRDGFVVVPANKVLDSVVATVRAVGGTVTRRGDDMRVVWPATAGLPVSDPGLVVDYVSTPRPVPQRHVVAVEPAGTAECVCISVSEPDGLYVTRDFLVTHNTTISLSAAAILETWPLLVVSPLAAFSTWARQLGEMGKHFYLAADPPKVAWQKIESRSFDAVVISYDRLHAFTELLENYGFRAVIADELQRISSPNSRRSRAMRNLAHAFPYRIGLSGTPMSNTLADLLPLGSFLVPGDWPSPRARAKDLADLFPGDPVEAIAEQLGTLMVRRRIDEVGVKLPGRTNRRVLVQLTVEQRRALEDLEREAVEEVDSGEPMTRMHVFAKLQKMRQIIGCPDAAGVPGPNPKVAAAIDLAQEFTDQDRKVVLFCANRRTWVRLGEECEQVGLEWVGIWGSSSVEERIDAERRFHEDPNVKVFIGTLQSCAESLTLSPTGSVVISTDYLYNPSSLAQAEARVYRLNQTNDVDIIYLHADIPGGGLDDRMVEILETKRQLIAQVVDRREHVDPTRIHYGMGDLLYLLTGRRDETVDQLEADQRAVIQREQALKEHAKQSAHRHKYRKRGAVTELQDLLDSEEFDEFVSPPSHDADDGADDGDGGFG